MRGISKTLLAAIVIALAGWLAAGYFFFAAPKQRSENNLADAATQYRYINKVIVADIGKHFIINFKPLKEKFLEIQARYSEKTHIYFVYLNNASWVGIGEKEMFYAASTVKVPLALGLMRAAEEGKLSLVDKYALQDLDLNSDFGDLFKEGVNKEISINDLLTKMLEESDNTATLAIVNILKNIGVADPLNDIYKFMGWEGKLDEYSYLNMNLKTLANMFITLYTAQYVGAESSNDILRHLDNSKFDKKIVAGVPRNLSIAHKEGIADNYRTFSDCGIVYAPNRDYILCAVMIDGTESKTNDFISELSRAAYDFVMNN